MSAFIHTSITLFYINISLSINATSTRLLSLDSRHFLVNMGLAFTGDRERRPPEMCMHISHDDGDVITSKASNTVARECGHGRNTSGRGCAREDATDGIRDGALHIMEQA
jgi:hypothetical protein